MRDILFGKKCYYTSKLTAAEIEAKLLSILKQGDGAGNLYAGKVRLYDFTLTPILDSRENFKVLMIGMVEKSLPTKIEVNYGVSPVVRFIIYSLIGSYLALFLAGVLLNISICILGIEHLEYYLAAAATFMLFGYWMTFSTQFITYSKLLEKYLALEEDVVIGGSNKSSDDII